MNVYGTLPLVYDTDGDGTSDGYEVQLGFDPTNPNDDPDKDEDQILDSWERDHFGNIILCNPGDDPDGDLYSNLEEFNNGTDPLVMDTYVELYPAFEVTWKAVAGTNYQVQVNTNLTGGTWSDVGTPVTGSGSRTGILIRTGNTDSKMYRIEILP